MFPTLSENRWLRLGTLCALYVAQGLPFGFVSQGLRDFLHGNGVAAAETGALIALISLPWMFKAVWGPIIDRYGIPAMGRRRPWILLAQTLMALAIFCLIFVPNLTENFRVLSIAILVVNVFASIQDVAVDALAVDLLQEKERGKANGFIYGSSYLGSWLGGFVVGGYVLNNFGIRAGLITLSCVILVIMILPLLFKERRGEKRLPWSSGEIQTEVERSRPHSLVELFRFVFQAFFGRTAALVGLVFAFVAQIGIAALAILSSSFLIQDQGWDKAEYNLVVAGWASWISLAGCFAAGFIADKIGPRRTICIACIVLGAGWLVFGNSGEEQWQSRRFITTLVFVQAFFQGMLSIAMFTMFMGLSDRKVGATQFTTFMAFLNFSTFAGNKFAEFVDRNALYVPAIYIGLGCFQIAILALLFWIRPRKKEIPHRIGE
ncbi:MAG: MFS transporter [Verrucomicrobiales bacterium]|nr:MFS transporter [Verrucomicrobiales bacterium]